jgi:DnaJ-domain-containing protein 1
MGSMSFLRDPGDLSATPLAAILLEVWNLRLSGSLTVDQGGGSSRLYFRDGIPVGAQVYAGFKPLGHFLLAEGLIDIRVLERCLEEMARSRRPQGEILLEMGAIDRATLDRTLSAQQGGYVALIAGLRSGAYRFDPDEPVPPWTQGIRIHPMRAIVDALAAPQAGALVAAAIAQAGGAVSLGPGYADLADAFGWGEAEAAIVARLARPAPPEAHLAGVELPVERRRAVLAALVLLGLTEAQGGEGAAAADAEGVVDLADIAVPVGGEAGAGGGTGPPTVPVLAPPPVAPQAPPVLEPVSPARPPDAPPSPFWEQGPLPAPPVLSPDVPPGAPAPAPRAPAPAPPAAAPAPTSPQASPPAGRRSDPEEARARRQRLLARAMQNMGVGPLATPPPVRSGAAAPPAPGAGPSAAPAHDPLESGLRRALEFVAPRAREKDLFARLGLPRSASAEEVKAAYHQVVRQFHPDKYAAPGLQDLKPVLQELLAAVNEAYTTLSDRTRRQEYVARAGTGAAASSKEAADAARVDAQKAEACYRTRDYGKARLFFEAAIRGDPRAEYHAALAAVILADPRAPDRARVKELLAEATKDPSCDRAFFLAGVVARQEGEEARAERMFRAALAANPRNADAAREVKLVEGRRREAADARSSGKK